MALNKRVKQGGSYFKGYQLTVSAPTGDYVANITDTTKDRMINSIQLVPDNYGSGDYMSIGHFKDTGASAGLLNTVGSTLYNLGAGVGIGFEFPALEPLVKNEDFRVTYTNVAGTALVVNIIVEFVG